MNSDFINSIVDSVNRSKQTFQNDVSIKFNHIKRLWNQSDPDINSKLEDFYKDKFKAANQGTNLLEKKLCEKMSKLFDQSTGFRFRLKETCFEEDRELDPVKNQYVFNKNIRYYQLPPDDSSQDNPGSFDNLHYLFFLLAPAAGLVVLSLIVWVLSYL